MRRAKGTATNATHDASGQATAKAFIHCPTKFDANPRFIAVTTAVIIKAIKNAMVTGKIYLDLPSNGNLLYCCLCFATGLT